MKWIALTGPIGSGKTTLAKALEKEGYMMLNFTDLLKMYVAAAITPHKMLSVAEICQNKSRYRALLQEFGDVIGFSHEDRYVEEALAPWKRVGKPNAVFDNVRTTSQAGVVSEYGFHIVRLSAPADILASRVSYTSANHAIERGLPDWAIDLTLDATKSTSCLVHELIER